MLAFFQGTADHVLGYELGYEIRTHWGIWVNRCNGFEIWIAMIDPTWKTGATCLCNDDFLYYCCLGHHCTNGRYEYFPPYESAER